MEDEEESEKKVQLVLFVLKNCRTKVESRAIREGEIKERKKEKKENTRGLRGFNDRQNLGISLK